MFEFIEYTEFLEYTIENAQWSNRFTVIGEMCLKMKETQSNGLNTIQKTFP